MGPRLTVFLPFSNRPKTLFRIACDVFLSLRASLFVVSKLKAIRLQQWLLVFLGCASSAQPHKPVMFVCLLSPI